MLICIIFGNACLQNGLNLWRGVTGADVMTEEQIGITIIFFLDPTSSRYQSKGMVRIVSAKLPDKEI